jgi:hypothetical protein
MNPGHPFKHNVSGETVLKFVLSYTGQAYYFNSIYHTIFPTPVLNGKFPHI